MLVQRRQGLGTLQLALSKSGDLQNLCESPRTLLKAKACQSDCSIV